MMNEVSLCYAIMTGWFIISMSITFGTLVHEYVFPDDKSVDELLGPIKHPFRNLPDTCPACKRIKGD